MGIIGDILTTLGVKEILSWIIPEVDTGDQGQSLTKPSTDSHIPVIYGTRGKVAGKIAWMKTNDDDNDSVKNDLLHIIIVWCEGPIESIDQIYLDDVPIDDEKFEGWAFARHFTNGMNGDYADPILVAAGFDPVNYLFSNLAVSYIRLEYNKDGTFNGLPNITADIKGMLCLTNKDTDTRLTYATSNPAMQLYDYLVNPIYGKDLPHSRWNSTLLSQAISICDEQVETYQGSGELKPQFTSNIKVDTSRDIMENTVSLLKTMRGRLPIVDGQLELVLEVDHAEVDALVEGVDFLEQNLSFSYKPINERYNRVVATYHDPEQNWQPQDVVYPEKGSQTETDWLAEDGKPLEYKITLDGCTDYYEARTTARVIAQSSRETLTVNLIADPIATKYTVGDIIPITVKSLGWEPKPFRLDFIEVRENGEVELELVEHQAYIYTWLSETQKPAVPDTTLPNVRDVTQPAALTINVVDDGKIEIQWSSNYESFSYQLLLDDVIVDEGSTTNTFLKVDGLNAGSYSFIVFARNKLGYPSSRSQLNFELDEPAPPNITVTPSNFELIIEPVITGSFLGVTFELELGTSNDQNAADNYGTASNWTITGLAPDTDYWVWVRTINAAGTSAWATVQTKTLKDPANIIEVIKDNISSEHFDQATKDTLDQFASDIETNTSSNEATSNALQVANSRISTVPSNMQSTILSALTSINTDLEYREELLGYKASLTVVQDELSAQSTQLSQTATKVELEATKVTLRGEIQQIVAGDIDAILNSAIGDIQGEITALNFFVGEDNLNGQMTIGSYVDQIILEQDYATVSHVSQQITALGIENYVQASTFTDEVSRIDTALEVINNDFYRRAISSFSYQSNDVQSLKQHAALAEVRMMNNLLALQDDTKKFEGALAAADEQIKVQSSEFDAKVESTETQLARVNERVSYSERAINNVVNEQQVTAEKIETLEAADEYVLAQAQEYTRVSVGYCVDADGNITDDVDAVACVAAGHEWQNLPLSEAMDHVSVTVKDENNNDVKIKAGTLFQAFQDEWDGLLARAFFGVSVENGETGIAVSTNADGTISNIDFIGATARWLTPDLVPVLQYDTETNTISLPGATLTLTNQQKTELKGDEGAQGPQGPQGNQGPQGPQGEKGDTATVIDNGDGTYTIHGENGSIVISDGANPTVTDNEDGTYTVTDPSGNSVIISDGYTPRYGFDYFDGASGNYISNVYKNVSETSAPPAKPTDGNGSYNGSTETLPTGGWTDSFTFEAGKITYVSQCIYKELIVPASGETPAQKTWTPSVWSDPVPFIQRGRDGEDGAPGVAGQSPAGDWTWIKSDFTGTWPSNADITAFLGRLPLVGDKLTISNGDNSNPNIETQVYNGTNWIDPVLLVDGSLIARDSVSGDTLIAGTRIRSPKVEYVGTTHMRISSATGFGSSNQFIEWFGPKLLSSGEVNYSALTESNAITFLKTDGSAYFGGAITSGALTTSLSTSDLSETAQVEIGPFGSNGGAIAINCSVTMSSLYAQYTTSQGSPRGVPSCTIVLEEYVGSSWVQRQSANYTGTEHFSSTYDDEMNKYLTSSQQVLSESFTYTDNKQTTTDRTYRVRMTSRTNLQTLQSEVSQRLSIHSQE